MVRCSHIAVLVAVASAFSFGQQGMDGAARLLTTRDTLLKRLDDRLAADARDSAPFEISLLFDEGMVLHGTTIKQTQSGIRREVVEFTACRYGPNWLNPKFSSPNRELNDRLYIEKLDASGLQWTDGSVTGRLALMVGRQTRERDMGESGNMHAMLKSQTRPVVGWTIGGRRRIHPSEQTFDLDVKGDPEYFLLELTLSGLAGSERRARPPTNHYVASWSDVSVMHPYSRVDVEVSVMHGSQGWLPGHGRSPSWNLALHDVDATGLKYENNRVSGKLAVILNPDPWVPGGAKSTLRLVTLDLPVVYGRIEGVYLAKEENGESFEGRVSGNVWSLLIGEFRTKCVDGEWSGPVKGKLRRLASDVKSLGLVTKAAVGDEVAPLLAGYSDASAVLMALCNYPPTPESVFERLKAYAPASGGNAQTVARCAEAMAGYVSGCAADLEHGRVPAVGLVATGDASFGPFGDSAPMSGSGGKANVIPETKGGDAPQQWQHPVNWRAIGPLVKRGRGGNPPSRLPAMVPLTDVEFVNERFDLGRTVTHAMKWKDLPARMFPVKPDGDDWRAIWIADNKMSSYSAHDSIQAYRAREATGRSFEWYATTEVHAHADGETWFAISCMDFGRLWVNDALVWESGENYNSRRPAVFPVRLQAGRNRLLVLCGQAGIGYYPPGEDDQSQFRLWVCTAGRPSVSTDSAGPARAIDEGRFTIAGYMNDTSRKYPDVNPPVAWNIDKGINVAWENALLTGGEPVVWGGDLYMNVEPHTLACLDKMTGRVKWTATNSILELVDSDAWRSKPAAIDAMAKALRTINEIAGNIGDVNRRLADEEIEESEVAPLTKQKAELDAKIELLRKPFAGLTEYLRSIGVATYPSDGTIGTFAGTVPVVTDEGIWAYYGMGTLVCYGHDGIRRWMVRVPYSTSGSRGKSPLLVGDKNTGTQRLLIQGAWPATNSWTDAHVVMAFDPATGKQIWQTPPLEGSPPEMMALRIGGAGGGTVALVTGNGVVVDAFSGSILQGEVSTVGGQGIPYAYGDKLYFANARGQSRVSLSLSGSGKVMSRTDWVFRRGGNGGTWPITDGDCLYVPRLADEFHPHHVVPWDQMNVYDGESGQHLSRPNPVLVDATTPEPVVMAGNYLYYSDSSRPGSWSTGRGQIAVMTRGESPFVLARNGVGGSVLNTIPVFDGDRMYIRTGGKVICIRVQGEAGERIVEETMAEAVMREVKRRPESPPIRRPQPIPGFRETPSVAIVRLGSRVPVGRWLQLGPIPLADEGDPLEALGGVANAHPAAGTEVKYRDVRYRFDHMADDALLAGRLARIQYEGSTLYVPAKSISVIAAAKKQKFTTSYFYSVLHVAVPTFMRFETKGVLAGAWLAGEAIKDGDCVRFAPGYYALMLRIDLKAVPPIGTPVVSAQFDEMDDPAEVTAIWREDIRRLKPRLERIVARLPGSTEASVAEVYLKQLDEPAPSGGESL